MLCVVVFAVGVFQAVFWVSVFCSGRRRVRDEEREISTGDLTDTDIEDTSSYREHRCSAHEYALLIDEYHPGRELPSPKRRWWLTSSWYDLIWFCSCMKRNDLPSESGVSSRQLVAQWLASTIVLSEGGDRPPPYPRCTSDISESSSTPGDTGKGRGFQDALRWQTCQPGKCFRGTFRVK